MKKNILNKKNNLEKKLPTEDEIIDTILNSVFIRGIDLETYRREFTDERSGLITNLNNLYKSKLK